MVDPTSVAELDSADSTVKRPLVSVVITTLNRSRLVAEAIESVLAAKDQNFDLEIIVVDDGSTDDTQDVLANYPVKVVSAGGVGFRSARNAGFVEANGDFIQFLDDDDCLTPESLTSRLAVFADHPEYGMVHGRTQLTDMELQPVGDPIPHGQKDSGWILEDLLRYFPQVGAILTRREVLDELGGFSKRWNDDWELSLRAAKITQVGRIETTSVLFRQREGADEERQWRATEEKLEIFGAVTAHLSLVERIRLRPIFWKQRGWHAAYFVRCAFINWENGERQRTIRSLWYAMRWSPIHTPVNVLRHLLAR